MTTTILEVLVGSQAHGLATPDSDYDYRGVFLQPTSALLTLGSKPTQTNWIENDRDPAGAKQDNTSWELGHFLFLATKCNPTILEVFKAPIVQVSKAGHDLRALFPHVWNRDGVHNAFIGYGLNQRTSFLDNRENRRNKYATAYLRTLYNAWELLTLGDFNVDITRTAIEPLLRRTRAGDYTAGQVIDWADAWTGKVADAYQSCRHVGTDYAAINRYLLDVRQNNW